MNLLRTERDTLDGYIPGLDKYLSDRPLLELEQPGDGALQIFRALGGLGRAPGFGADQGGDSRVAAQLVQAAAAGGPDAADRDAQPGAVTVTDAHQNGAEALIPGSAVELREVQPLGSHA